MEYSSVSKLPQFQVVILESLWFKLDNGNFDFIKNSTQIKYNFSKF
jgi:hypothetical protein